MGRSDTREALRQHFEIDADHIVAAVLSALHHDGRIAASVVEEAIASMGIDPAAVDPYLI
jgi:pyruvate dehydrogenase E1 component